MTNFELNTLETLLRMFQQEIEEKGTSIEMFGNNLTEEELEYYTKASADLRYLANKIKKN